MLGFSFFINFVLNTVWGGGSPPTNAFFREKQKVSVFENGQFSGHLIFYKKTFLPEEFFSKFPKLFCPQKICQNVFEILSKKISPKNIFFQKKRKMFFFQKNKVLVYRRKKAFFALPKKFLIKN